MTMDDDTWEKVKGLDDISRLCNPYTGDCVDIAFAIAKVNDGEVVASYANEQEFMDGVPAHAVAKVDGELYDGGGKTSKEALRDRAYNGIDDFEDIVIREIPDSPKKNPERVELISENLPPELRDL